MPKIKDVVTVGAVFDVTNHYITRPDHPCYGTVRRTVTQANSVSFHMAAENGETSRIEWPKAARHRVEPNGTIHITGGGVAQRDTPDAPFLTLTPVTEGPTA